MSEVISGIGIDLVSISEIRELDERTKGVFTARTFTGPERKIAESISDPWTFLAGRFAVKEAVFKAVAQLTPEKTFDFRMVETLKDKDGAPVITMTGALRPVLEQAAVTKLLVSITHQGDLVIAEVVAVNEKDISQA